MSVSRRSFLKSSAAATAIVLSEGIAGKAGAISLSSTLTPGPGNKWPGRVAINFNKNAVLGTDKPQVDVIKKMIDDTIKILTGLPTVGAAWKEIFPANLSLQSKIAIKINTANSSLPGTHWASVRGITDGLQSMDFNGTKFPAANITIYDMDFGGGMAKLGFTKDNFPGIALTLTAIVDGGDGAMNNHKYAVALKNADYLINVFTPRGHTYPPAGSRFTLGFKSHVGTYSSEASKEGPSLHDKLMENIRDMSCTGPVFNKNVLSMCSGIGGLNEGNGPPGTAEDYKKYAKTMDDSISAAVNPTTIILSTDPIAAEMQTIKMMRINKAGKYDIASMPPYLQSSAGIADVMDGTLYNIGIIDETKMDIRRMINEITSIERPVVSHNNPQGMDIAVSSIYGQKTTFFEFKIPLSHLGMRASVNIFAFDGKLVCKRSIGLGGAVNHFSWNHQSIGGAMVGQGSFLIRITCGDIVLSKNFSIV